MSEFIVDTPGKLKDFFMRAANEFDSNQKSSLGFCYIPEKLRRDWLLNHSQLIIQGQVQDLEFQDMKGGVWRATIKEPQL